jgi:hypothetical protein
MNYRDFVDIGIACLGAGIVLMGTYHARYHNEMKRCVQEDAVYVLKESRKVISRGSDMSDRELNVGKSLLDRAEFLTEQEGIRAQGKEIGTVGAYVGLAGGASGMSRLWRKRRTESVK